MKIDSNGYECEFEDEPRERHVEQIRLIFCCIGKFLSTIINFFRINISGIII